MAAKITIDVEGVDLNINMSLDNPQEERVTTVVVANLLVRMIEHASESPLMGMLAVMAQSGAVVNNGVASMPLPDMLMNMLAAQAEAEARKGEKA